MARSEHESLWTTMAPAVWPDAPPEMTVTTLTGIEACPRRWALGAADYPTLWTGRGYPPRVQLSALAGTVVHLALEVITKRLVWAGCPSVQDPLAVKVMKGLGGHTRVVNECIDRVIEGLTENPRGRRLLEFAARWLRAQVPELRTRVQTILSGLGLPQVAVPRTGDHTSHVRGPLTTGVFPEIELRARQIGWKGKVDLLLLSPGASEITDFKTGEPSDAHRFQIQVYALLWSRDAELNPEGRRANRLVLAYSSGDAEVPALTDAELDALEREIVTRREAARQAVSRQPPEARPDPDSCLHCGVRQLCNEYWTPQTQRLMANEARDRRFGDIEVTISSRRGASSWDAIVECSSIVKRGQPILLRADNPTFAFYAGQRVRLISVHLSVPDEQAWESEQPAVIGTMGAGSEAFIVSR